MTQQDTQPPAETLAECPFCGADAVWREYDPAQPDVGSGLVVDHSPECFLCWPCPVRDDQSIRVAWNSRAALTRRAGGDTIPAGMKPWHGGDAAPEDWDGGPVLLRDGTSIDRGDGKAKWRHASPGSHMSLYDAIAYTPKPRAGGECPCSPDSRHQVDTSMESGPNHCFHCEAPMGGANAR